VGAVVFTALSAMLDRWAQPGAKSVPADEFRGSAKLNTDAAAQEKALASTSTRGAAGMALLAAVTLDGVPENIALARIRKPSPCRWHLPPGPSSPPSRTP
jgi:ZIP family zinc transporter